METIDPTTGRPLPPDAIQRILYIARKVHIYQIPPATTTKGYNAASWTANDNANLIFTARLRLLETAVPNRHDGDGDDQPSETVTTSLLLEDPSTGDLFAAAPYTSPAVVEQALDSSRFFAVRVVGEGGRKATLGVGFEERSDAVDFSIALQDSRKVLGFEPTAGGPGKLAGAKGSSAAAAKEDEKRDFSLKEGETITVNIGGRGRRRQNDAPPAQQDAQAALFSIGPPPSAGKNNGGAVPFLPPPPTASEVKAERRRSKGLPLHGQVQPRQAGPTAQELGFDDGEFGEFQ
ncbi:uncharacterized protein K452DRAFT_357317 [Aplosporella prunicola CBS 121167]|uniref:NECAP PHear domain-containing protein n=1 Tax=Aplosporella prunicola CBS 121167 TaxID=1176127 RepID=A0A6A6BK71_9PEZI|nr:uncharacterized protein K452DRAFT_357317 [Aplosporella prunicola CBS 121167]KAF2143674.1 hypothetical protein K452DRAFT_357317 [Aplosporella prunicola CBS 121167]